MAVPSRQTVTTFVNRHCERLAFGLLVVLLFSGLVSLELRVPDRTALDDDDVSTGSLALVPSTGDTGDLLSFVTSTTLTDDVTPRAGARPEG